MTPQLALGLAACVALAFLCEAVAGFGGTVLALALGGQLVPIEQLLPALLPVNLILSAVLVARHSDAVDWRLLLRRVLPAVALGMPAGLVMYRYAGPALEPMFAGVVIGLAGLEAGRLAARREVRTLSPVLGTGLLVISGVVHGAYGTGGPLLVFVAGNDVVDKRALRATLAVLWIALNLVLAAAFVVERRIDSASLATSLILLPAVALALAGGEWLFTRVPERPFRVLVAGLLGVAGVLLLLRGV